MTGYFFGNIPFVQQNLKILLMGIVLVSLCPALIEYIRIKINEQQYEKFLLNRFVPKESKFFPLLNQLSQTVLNASELLIDSMNHDTPETWQEYYHKVKEAERKGDQITQQIFMELGQTFITPLTGKTYMTWPFPLMT